MGMKMRMSECPLNRMFNCPILRERDYLLKRKMERHDETSLKWRAKAFYYKRKYLEVLGKGGKDGETGVCNHGKEKGVGEGVSP